MPAYGCMYIFSVVNLFIRISPAFPTPQPGLQPAGPHNSFFLPPKLCWYHLSTSSSLFIHIFLSRSAPILQMLQSQKLLLICFLFLTVSDLPPTALDLPLRSSRLPFLPCTAIPALPMPLLLARKPAHLKDQELCIGQRRFTCIS